MEIIKIKEQSINAEVNGKLARKRFNELKRKP